MRKAWPRLLALVIFFLLLGGYYARLTVETRTYILPLLIFITAAIMFGRMKQFPYAVGSASVTALEIVTQQLSRLALELIDSQPALKIIGEKGSAKVQYTMTEQRIFRF